MSIQLMSKVWDINDSELNGSRLLLLLSLADYANSENICWPSYTKLAQRARVSERQVQRIVQWLVQRGHIEIVIPGNGKGHSAHYRITPKVDIGDNLCDETKVDTQRAKVDTQRAKVDIAVSTDPPIDPPIDPPGESRARAALPPPDKFEYEAHHNYNAVFGAPAPELDFGMNGRSGTAPPLSQDQKETKALVDRLLHVGGPTTPYVTKTYRKLAKEIGLENVLRGLTAAAENGKQNNVAYVTACARNAQRGDSVTATPRGASGYAPAKTSGGMALERLAARAAAQGVELP